MRFRLLKLRFRRRLELGEKRAGDISQQAELDLENYLLRRLGRLQQVKRFVGTWTLLLVIGIVGTAGQNYLLSDYYQKMAPYPAAYITKESWVPLQLPTRFMPSAMWTLVSHG